MANVTITFQIDEAEGSNAIPGDHFKAPLIYENVTDEELIGLVTAFHEFEGRLIELGKDRVTEVPF